MASAQTESLHVIPLSAAEVELVHAELRSLLTSDEFAGSQRCRDFLKLVTDTTLDGSVENLTERFLGVNLFGRAHDYETGTDAIVRVRANDVRRRLSQYYANHPDSAVKIELAAGGYVPEFHWNRLRPQTEPAAPLAAPPLVPSGSLQGSFYKDTTGFAFRLARKYWQYATLSCAVIALIVTAVRVIKIHDVDGLSDFWEPVLRAASPPIIDMPTTDTIQLTMDPERSLAPVRALQPGQPLILKRDDFLAFHDWHISAPVMQAALSISLLLDRHGKTPIVRIGTDLRRDEVRGHPLIAIGSFSNPWAEHAVSGLRFTFDRGASKNGAPQIHDSLHPDRVWSLPHTYPEAQDRDYAIITRTFDPDTHEPSVSLSGLHSFGNQIAGEFLSQRSLWDEVTRKAPQGWQAMNMQVLLEADVVGTTPASPQIVDMYFWK